MEVGYIGNGLCTQFLLVVYTFFVICVHMIKTTSVRLSEQEQDSLNLIAKSVGCDSWRVMLKVMASGSLDVVKHGKAWGLGMGLKAEHTIDPKQLSWVEPKSPGCEEVVFPPKNPYVRQVELSENVVDTSEFDRPVPQRRPVAPAIAPQVAPVGAIPVVTNLSPEQKRSAFEQLKGILKTASDLKLGT